MYIRSNGFQEELIFYTPVGYSTQRVTVLTVLGNSPVHAFAWTRLGVFNDIYY